MYFIVDTYIDKQLRRLMCCQKPVITVERATIYFLIAFLLENTALT